MLFNKTTFIGIDPAASQRSISFAAIDHELRLLAVASVPIDDIFAFIAGQQTAIVAISSPRRPNQGLMRDPDLRRNLKPTPRPGRWHGFRLAEYLLFQHKIRIPRTPSESEKCPSWMSCGYTIYDKLEEMDFQLFPSKDAQFQTIEVYPHAAFSVLLKRIPFNKNSLEGRLQRQLVLYSHNMDIADPMKIFEEITRFRVLNGILPLDNLYTPSELDSLVAAYTAWKAALEPDEIIAMGDIEEGQIILPISELKLKY